MGVWGRADRVGSSRVTSNKTPFKKKKQISRGNKKSVQPTVDSLHRNSGTKRKITERGAELGVLVWPRSGGAAISLGQDGIMGTAVQRQWAYSAQCQMKSHPRRG